MTDAVYTYFMPTPGRTFNTKEDAIRSAIYENSRGRQGIFAAPEMGQPAPVRRAFLMQAVAEIDISSPQLEATIPELPKI